MLDIRIKTIIYSQEEPMIAIDIEKLNKLIDSRIETRLKEITAKLNMNGKPEYENRAWLTSKEAAKYLALKLSTLHKYSCCKRASPIPFEKYGKRKKYKIEDLDRWRSDRTITVKSDDELARIIHKIL